MKIEFTHLIFCKLAVKQDCLHIISSSSSNHPKGYYPIAYLMACSNSDALLKSIPKKFVVPDEELHAQLNLFNKRRYITHYVYSKLSKRADCIHIFFTASLISVAGYRHISSLNAFSISDAMHQFIPKIFFTPWLELQVFLAAPNNNPFPQNRILE